MSCFKNIINYICSFFSCCRKEKDEDPRKYTYYKLDNTSFYNNNLYKELTFENLKHHNERNNCYKRISDENNTDSLESICYENYYDNIN